MLALSVFRIQNKKIKGLMQSHWLGEWTTRDLASKTKNWESESKGAGYSPELRKSRVVFEIQGKCLNQFL